MTRAARASLRILGPLHSLFLLTLLALLLALGLAGCATGPPSPNAMLAGGYESVALYQRQVAVALDRGRINAAQGAAAVDAGEKARKTVDDARSALSLCGGKLPCDSFQSMLARLQPLLAQYERELREAEAKGAKP